MIAIKRILCPVDFSDFSRRALDYAIRIAAWYDARVTALHVAPIGVPVAVGVGGPAAIEPALTSAVDRAKLHVNLQAFVDAERGDGEPVDVEIVEGQVWREIAERGRDLEADLLVLGTHGRSGFGRLLVGSVTEKLLRAAACPVLTVPPGIFRPLPMEHGLFRRILCPTDFSPAAERAMAWAVSLAQEANAELVALHVFEERTHQSEVAFPRAALAQYREAYEAWCAARLHQSVPAAARTWCTVRELRAAGVPHEEILVTAIDHDCDLIVMGVGRHRGIGDRVFGSTSQHVVRAAACPVLTTRLSPL